ncbi:MAG: hypothetical protein ACC657_18105, partial [Thiohalomonadales bacterium]
MMIFSKTLLKPLFFILALTNVNLLAAEDTSEIDFDDNTALKGNNLHPQLNALYKRNQFMTIQLSTRNKSLDKIISTLKKLDDKINYTINSNNTPTNSNNLTMADFNTMDDDLIRKCDEIVDNYYSRKTQQEKNYVQQLYNTEQNDPQWERNVENQIQNFIDNNNLNQSAFFDINCKNSVCKFRVQHTTNEASQQFKGKLREEREFKIYNSQNKFDRV